MRIWERHEACLSMGYQNAQNLLATAKMSGQTHGLRSRMMREIKLREKVVYGVVVEPQVPGRAEQSMNQNRQGTAHVMRQRDLYEAGTVLSWPVGSWYAPGSDLQWHATWYCHMTSKARVRDSAQQD